MLAVPTHFESASLPCWFLYDNEDGTKCTSPAQAFICPEWQQSLSVGSRCTWTSRIDELQASRVTLDQSADIVRVAINVQKQTKKNSHKKSNNAWMETGVQQRWILFYFLLFHAAKLESYCALTKTIIFYRLKTNSVSAAHVLTLSQPARVLRNTCVTN